MTMTITNNLITIQECAKLLKCSVRSIQNMMKKKDFPRIKVAGIGVRIILDKLAFWLQSKAANTPAKIRVKKEVEKVDAVPESVKV